VTQAELRRALAGEGVSPSVVERAAGYAWGNGPGDAYGAHRHDYDKVLLCLAGSITFRLPEADRSVTLNVDDRLDLAADTLHAAVVGPSGVRCYELHLPAGSLRRDA
jgi:hypothetical protein